jgi:hypothetical protein
VKQVCGILLAIPLLGFAGIAPLLAEEQPLPPIERLQKSLLGMQKNLQNAKVKLTHGMSGLAPPGGQASTERQPTPAEQCCASNVERINAKAREMAQTLDQLDLYYADTQNSEGLARLDPIRGELHTVSQGVAIFRMAGNRDRAGQALLGIIRPFNRLRDAINELSECCPVPGSSGTGGAPDGRRP